MEEQTSQVHPGGPYPSREHCCLLRPLLCDCCHGEVRETKQELRVNVLSSPQALGHPMEGILCYRLRDAQEGRTMLLCASKYFLFYPAGNNSPTSGSIAQWCGLVKAPPHSLRRCGHWLLLLHPLEGQLHMECPTSSTQLTMCLPWDYTYDFPLLMGPAQGPVV